LPEEIGGGVRGVDEYSVDLGHPCAEAHLVAILLFELQCEVDRVGEVRGLVDLNVLLVFDRLEVAELVEAPDAHLQRFTVEDTPFVNPHLTPDHLIARRGVADERDAVDQVSRPLVHAERHIDHRRVVRRVIRPAIARPQIGIRREFEPAERAVQLPRLGQPIPNVLLAVELALANLEERQEIAGRNLDAAFHRRLIDRGPSVIGTLKATHRVLPSACPRAGGWSAAPPSAQ
jgi:hypothetical protein